MLFIGDADTTSMYVLGGSVYAVAYAARLSRMGHRVTLVSEGGRAGLFPHALLPEEFFEEVDVEPSVYSEADFTEAWVEGLEVGLPTRLYLVRTTPVLERVLARSGVTVSRRVVDRGEEVFDCRPHQTGVLKTFQTLVVEKDVGDVCLQVRAGQGLEVAARWRGLTMSYRYAWRDVVKNPDTIGFAERYIHYFTPEPRAMLSWLGPDVAEAVAALGLDAGYLEKPPRAVGDVFNTLLEYLLK